MAKHIKNKSHRKIDPLSNWSIFLIFIILSTAIYYAIKQLVVNPLDHLLDIASIGVLWITAFVILIYTRQTRDLKNAALDLKEVAGKQLAETRR